MDSSPHTPKPLGTEAIRAYWEALGHFISQFAAVEATMQLALWHYAKVSTNTGRAVFSGIRADAAIKLINRIAEVENWNKTTTKEFKELFDHLGSINSLRNDIIHFGVRRAADASLQVTNAFMALTNERLRQHPVSDKILGGMTRDLAKINYALLLRMFADQMPQNIANSFRQQIDAPWQYRPSQQSNRSKKTRRTPQGRSRPRGSSPA